MMGSETRLGGKVKREGMRGMVLARRGVGGVRGKGS